mmetsp:Transcript_27815/g.38316  ORF Transcript_27815/g.38316 Transcript_27815/m.38316 type:complete len:208 (-) Transcript_27815:411-1034(-)
MAAVVVLCGHQRERVVPQHGVGALRDLHGAAEQEVRHVGGVPAAGLVPHTGGVVSPLQKEAAVPTAEVQPHLEEGPRLMHRLPARGLRGLQMPRMSHTLVELLVQPVHLVPQGVSGPQGQAKHAACRLVQVVPRGYAQLLAHAFIGVGSLSVVVAAQVCPVGAEQDVGLRYIPVMHSTLCYLSPAIVNTHPQVVFSFVVTAVFAVIL